MPKSDILAVALMLIGVSLAYFLGGFVGACVTAVLGCGLLVVYWLQWRSENPNADLELHVVQPGAISPPMAEAASLSETPNPDRLECVGWVNGGTISAPNRFDGEASLIEVKSMAVAIPKAAEDVRTALAYQSDAGVRFVVSNAPWWECHRNGTASSSQWATSIVRMEGGESQYFVLWISKNGKMELYREDGWPVGVIEFGHWEVTIQVTSTNFEGFEGILGFTYGPDGLIRDSRTAVVMQRRLPPRFPSSPQRHESTTDALPKVPSRARS